MTRGCERSNSESGRRIIMKTRVVMKTWVARKLLAAAIMLLSCGTALHANDMRFTEIERRLGALEAQSAAQQGVQTAAHVSNVSYSQSEVVGSGCGCQSCTGCATCCDAYCGNYYGEVHFLWFRPHASNYWVGKLSESHDFSARYVVGYEDRCGLGGRVRYWNLDDQVRVYNPGTIVFELDVLDVEATNRFHFRRTDLVLAGGFRYAGWDLTCDDGQVVDLDAYGLTIAADARTPICRYGCNLWSFVYGGRLSVLAGEWRGSNNLINTVVTPPLRDDNLLVHELYAGVEYGYCYCGYEWYMRATFEMQNWHSDVLSEPGVSSGISPISIGSTDSIVFMGPSLQLGVRY
jgi:hypothetical protein